MTKERLSPAPPAACCSCCIQSTAGCSPPRSPAPPPPPRRQKWRTRRAWHRSGGRPGCWLPRLLPQAPAGLVPQFLGGAAPASHRPPPPAALWLGAPPAWVHPSFPLQRLRAARECPAPPPALLARAAPAPRSRWQAARPRKPGAWPGWHRSGATGSWPRCPPAPPPPATAAARWRPPAGGAAGGTAAPAPCACRGGW